MKSTIKIILLLIFLGIVFISYEKTTKNNLEKVEVSSTPFIKENPSRDLEKTFFGISFPAVQDLEQIELTKRVLRDTNTNRVRFSVRWEFTEPEKGLYKWDTLDSRIHLLREQNISILLTIESDGPEWACSSLRNEKSCVYSDLPAFERWVEKLSMRYKDSIDYIQFGNEMISEDFFVGTVSDYIVAQNLVYDIFKKNAPDVSVVMGGIATGTIRRYALCQNDSITTWGLPEFKLEYDRERINKEWCNKSWVQKNNAELESVIAKSKFDILDVHLYDDYPFWKLYIETIKEKTDNTYPILVTEFGGPNNYIHGTFKIFSDSVLTEQMNNFMRTIQTLDIDAAYFFKLVELGGTEAHSQSGLYNQDATEKNPQYSILKNR